MCTQVEQLLAGKSEKDLRTWCQVPEPEPEPETAPSLDKLKGLLGNRLASTGGKSLQVDLDLASSSCILTMAAGYEDGKDGKMEKDENLDLSAMDAFAPDAAGQLREAQRLGGQSPTP